MPKFLTNQNIELDLELASVGDRIVAYIIDALILAAYFVFILILVSGFSSGELTIFILSIPMFFYSLLFEIFGNGQTPGKRARNIKVVTVTGGEATLGKYLLRWLFRLIDIYFMYGAVGVITIAVTKNGQRIGDMVAKTTIIKIREIGSVKAFSLNSTSEHQLTFPMSRLLTDEQIELMKKAIRMLKENNNTSGVAKMAEKLKEKLQIETSLSDLEFIQTVIDDYEFLANE